MIFNRITPEEAARLGYIHEVEEDLIDSEDNFTSSEDDLDELENYTSDEEEYNFYIISRNVGDNK